jgi:lipoprotein-releasing system permease protein
MGVMVGTMALIVILSVFNGFDSLVKSLINSFNPDLKITLVEGKTFIPDKETIRNLKAVPGVLDISFVLEDNVLVRYDELQTNAVLKGVSDNYAAITGLDSMMVDGSYNIGDTSEPLALVGRGISIYLNIRPQSPRQMTVFVPRRLKQLSLDAERALNRQYISIAGVFSIEQDYDTKYILVPLSFARDLFEYTGGEVNILEVKFNKEAGGDAIQKSVSDIVGKDFVVQNRYQQNDLFYKTMQTEKWAIFLILIFILIVASFNVIGTLTMLMLEKKKDIITLRNLGADSGLLRRIFLVEGWMITASGAIFGAILGLIICWLQMRFGIIKLQGSGTFIIDAYPVLVKFTDVALVLVSVIIIGLFAAWYPIHFLNRGYVEGMKEE